MFIPDWNAHMTPQKATLDIKFIFRDSSPIDVSQFQFSLSAAALDMYLYGRGCQLSSPGEEARGLVVDQSSMVRLSQSQIKVISLTRSKILK
jgi:hypothetical protein